MLPERARFKGVCIPFPSYEQFHSICDKTTVLEAARALGMARSTLLSRLKRLGLG